MTHTETMLALSVIIEARHLLKTGQTSKVDPLLVSLYAAIAADVSAPPPVILDAELFEPSAFADAYRASIKTGVPS
jgi:hypothetical protein